MISKPSLSASAWSVGTMAFELPHRAELPMSWTRMKASFNQFSGHAHGLPMIPPRILQIPMDCMVLGFKTRIMLGLGLASRI